MQRWRRPVAILILLALVVPLSVSMLSLVR
jgi:hypothetical protein